MSRSCPDNDPFHRCAALETWFICPGIDTETAQIVSCLAVRKQVGQIIEGGSSALDRFGQDFLYGQEQPGNFGRIKTTTWCQRMDSGKMKGFVGVDVAEAGYRTLVQEESLDGRGSTVQGPHQNRNTRRIDPSIGAKSGESRV